MKTNKNQKRKLRVKEKERDMVKSLPREQNLVGAKHQQAKAHLQQVPARDCKDKVPARVHKDKVLKSHHMGHRYPMIMKQKFLRMKFQQWFYTTSLSKCVILHRAGNSEIHGIRGHHITCYSG